MPRINGRDALAGTMLPALILLTWLVSRAALTGPFIFDDYPNLSNLARLAGNFDLYHIADYLQAFTGDPGRPLAALSFLIDDYAWPTSPAGFKRTNLLLHLLGGVLVFGFVRSIAGASLNRESSITAALLAAAAWLLHPMQLSTSMLVVQRMTQLMALVSLSALWWASAFVQRTPLTIARTLGLLVGIAIATLLAFLCKENGALLPLYTLILLFVLLRTTLQDASPAARRLLMTALMIPVIVVVLQITWLTAQYTPDGLREFTPNERILTQFRVLSDYLGRIALPRLDGSGLFHDDYVASHGLTDPPSTLFALVACLTLLIAAAALRQRTPLFAFAVFWFFGGHLIESSPLPLELYFEHRNYLPMVGPFAAAAIALSRLPIGKMRRIYFSGVIAWLALCAAMTAIQSRVWSSEAILAEVWAQESPRSARAVELQVKVLTDIGENDAAYDTLKRAIEGEPSLRRLALDLVLIDCVRGTLSKQSITSAAQHIRESPFNRSSLEALGMLQQHMQQRSCGPALDAIGWSRLAQALLTNPKYRDNPEVAAYIWVEVAKSRIHRGDLVTANMALESSYAARPDPELAVRAYRLLHNYGLCGLALPWRSRVQRPAGYGFDAWMRRLASPQWELPPAQSCVPATMTKS